MQKTKAGSTDDVAADRRKGVHVVPRAYAGKWVAWSDDGRKIVAVADSYKACEQAAARVGLGADQVAIERVPPSRQRLTGSRM
jgi:hypothetical protein